jgi:hypothetical protein
MTVSLIHGRAGSPLPAVSPNAIHGAHGVTRPTWRFMDGVIGARLWSQTQPQRVEIAERAAAGASHTAAFRCVLKGTI